MAFLEREPKRSYARHVVLRASIGDAVEAGVATSAEGGAPDADEERQSTGRPRTTSAPTIALAESAARRVSGAAVAPGGCLAAAAVATAQEAAEEAAAAREAA